MRIKDLFFRVFTNRRIQVDLLTIFLTLLCISSLLVTGYTYKNYYKDIEELSSRTIDQTNSLLLEKVTDVKKEAQLLTEIIKGSIHTKAQATGQDPDYTNFLLNILRNDPFLSAIAIATPTGDFFSIMNVNLEHISHFYSHSADKLPKETQFIIRTILQNGPASKELWKYVDKEGKDRKSTRLNSSHSDRSRMPSSA